MAASALKLRRSCIFFRKAQLRVGIVVPEFQQQLPGNHAIAFAHQLMRYLATARKV